MSQNNLHPRFVSALQSNNSLNKTGTGVSVPLELRKFSSENDFSRAVLCQPGIITVLFEGGPESFEEYRRALKNPSAGGNIKLRYDSSPVHSSEIFITRIGDSLWEEYQLSDALIRAGVPRNLLQQLLQQMELVDDVDYS